MVRLIVAVIIIAAVLMLFNKSKSGLPIGSQTPGRRTSALVPGHRSEAPNSAYVGSAVQ